MSTEPAYTRLAVEDRRRKLLDAGAALFAEYAFDELTMRQIAEAAGVSKALLYHYFPSKIDLFKAAVQEAAAELQRLIEPSGQGVPVRQLADSLSAYLSWIEANARMWAKLMQSASTLAEARELVEGFRTRTMEMILANLTGHGTPRPALRSAISGWLGYMDAAIYDWVQRQDLSRDQLQDMLLAAFGAALLAAHQVDPEINLTVSESAVPQQT